MKRTLGDLVARKHERRKIVMVTAYDAPSARLAEAAGIDVILVGDSAAMTVFAYDSTTAITLDDMLLLARAARRGAPEALLVADMPFGSVQGPDVDTVAGAMRFVTEAGADAVKIEGAGPALRRIGAVIDAGIPVMGHIGLTPQSVDALGGYKPQGRTALTAERLLDDAMTLEQIGCVAVVLEAIPAPVAARISRALAIPTIGIGAGAECDGQVLVWHDMLGLATGLGEKLPKFVKQYANLDAEIGRALNAYASDVRAGRFPELRHTYAMLDAELDLFELATKEN